MKCTSCKQGDLVPSFIDGLFRAHTCNHCEGNWLLIEDYVSWKEQHPDHPFASNASLEAEDSKTALFCPVSGTIMRKFKLSADTAHRIDYSAAVGGVWLDKGEWELLKKEGLAGSLNSVLTQQWQRSIQQQSSQQTFAALYREKFGEAGYQKAKELRAWLDSQPNKADLRTYLLAEDPYTAEK
ncbi:hypothetical protein EZV61_04420 [Corallincola luteus]|uniref:Transcription factor zinc-finger domain-containing protein n=1 Tax=Corallincola luteus TaxID=1775177 RepID=A0ABY2ARG4_9GAMM|nr:zf-TFIIB domain-containing protein [Corallincola luteus]TCI05213.1 hypothetical protein EZV61_04420 [Corallincola luteus]